jgi:Zn-dependent membrane protease YugP
MRQARIRSRVTPFFALAGIVAAFFNVYGLALLLFALPIIFNVIPGSLNALEKMFGFRL